MYISRWLWRSVRSVSRTILASNSSRSNWFKPVCSHLRISLNLNWKGLLITFKYPFMEVELHCHYNRSMRLFLRLVCEKWKYWVASDQLVSEYHQSIVGRLLEVLAIPDMKATAILISLSTSLEQCPQVTCNVQVNSVYSFYKLALHHSCKSIALNNELNQISILHSAHASISILVTFT